MAARRSWAPWFGERYSRKPKKPPVLGLFWGRPVYSPWAFSMLMRIDPRRPMSQEQIKRILDAEEATYG